MEDPLETLNKTTHCRFCAKQKRYTEVLDLQGDIKTFDEYINILDYLKIDYLDLSDLNRLPKTTCEKCYDAFQEAYKFFKILDHIQTVLKASYDANPKNDPIDTSKIETQSDAQNIQSIDSHRVTLIEPSDLIKQSDLILPTDLENIRECETLELGENSKLGPKINPSDKNIKISQCRFCAGQRNYTDLLNLLGENTIKEYVKMVKFFKIDYLSLDEVKLPKTVCELCYNSFHKVYKFLKSVKSNQDLLNNLYSIKAEPIKFKTEHSNADNEDSPYVDPEISQSKDLGPLSVLTLNYSNDDSWSNYTYICSHCQVIYDTIEELRAHSKERHGMCLAYRCADCNEKFGGFTDFVEHVRGHKEVLRLYCQYCNEQFDTAAQCSEHVNTHYIGTQKICELCGEMFPFANTLEWHKRLYGRTMQETRRNSGRSWDDYEWSCQECLMKMPDVASLRMHVQQIHNKCFAIKCMDCSKAMKSYKLFVAHVIGHKPYLKNYCQYCNAHFEDINDLNNHIIKHITSQQRPCTDCGQIFKDNTQLAKHKDTFKNHKPRSSVKREGTVNRRSTRNAPTTAITQSVPKRRRARKPPLTTEDLTCTTCRKVFDTLTKLSRHKKTHDGPRTKDFFCQICGKSFLTIRTMRDHVKTHSNKTEVCQVCKKEFHKKHQLKNHIITHSEVRPFVCDECGNSFKTKRRLKCHMKSHSDEKPFKCLYCYKEFKFKENLKTHGRQHTGVRPYACEMCERTFTNWANCNKHMIRKHGVTLARTKITSQGRVAINRRTGEAKSLVSDNKTKEWMDEMMKPIRRRKVPVIDTI